MEDETVSQRVLFESAVLLRIFATIEIITSQMLENAWIEIEYRSDILRSKKGTYVEVV
jgi:hypothetical protein